MDLYTNRRLIFVIEALTMLTHLCCWPALTVQTVSKLTDLASITSIPPNLCADFKFDRVFDGTVSYIEILWSDGKNSHQNKENGTVKQWQILPKTFLEGEFFENAYWCLTNRYGAINARVYGIKLTITKEFESSQSISLSAVGKTLKIELLREQKSEVLFDANNNSNSSKNRYAKNYDNKAINNSSDEPPVRKLPSEAQLLLIKAVTDLDKIKWLKIGPISCGENGKMQKSDGSKTILVVEVNLYGSKEKESDNHLHEKMNTLNDANNRKAKISSESSEEDDLKLIVEPEYFSLTEAVAIGNFFP